MSVALFDFSHSTRGIVSVCALLVLTTVSPVHAAEDAEVEPPQLLVPDYRSPLSAYQPYEDADPLDWKEANDRVGEIGGWRVYSREPFESDDTDVDSK